MLKMSMDCGFDIWPPLEVNAANRQTYERFLEEVKHVYGGACDDKILRSDSKIISYPANGTMIGNSTRDLFGS